MGKYDFDPPGHDNWAVNSIDNQHGSFRLPNMDWHPEDKRELIDFPCADNWLRYYYLRGMTPRRPIVYPQPQDRYNTAGVLKEGFESIGETIRGIQVQGPFVPYKQRPEPEDTPPAPPASPTTKGVKLE